MKKRAHFILSCCLSLVFVYAGFIKSMGTSSFYQDVRAYQLLPDQWAWVWSHFLPWLEIVTGIALLAKPTRLASSLLVSLLLLLFMSALLSAWIRGLNIECGCFGEEGASSNYAGYLSRDAVMLVISLYLFKSDFTQRAAAPSPPKS